MLTVLGSRAASILRGSFLRKLLRWGQAVLRMAEERGRTYCPSALALLGADSLGLQDAHAKWSCSWFLWQSQNRKTVYFSYINTRQEESTESSMEVTVSPTYQLRKHPVLYSHPDTQIRVEMAFSLL